MGSFVKGVMFLTVCAVGGIIVLLWAVGMIGTHIILRLLIGAAVISPFILILSVWIRTPFMSLKSGVLAFLLVCVVVVFTIAGLDVISELKTTGSLADVTGVPSYYLLAIAAIILLTLATS